MCALSRLSRGSCPPEVVDTLSIKEALSWIKENNQEDVVLETNCLLVVQALRSKIRMDSYFGSIIEDCKSLWTKPTHVNICFVQRSANKVAHSFARVACYFADHVWEPHLVSVELCSIIAANAE